MHMSMGNTLRLIRSTYCRVVAAFHVIAPAFFRVTGQGAEGIKVGTLSALREGWGYRHYSSSRDNIFPIEKGNA